MQYVMDHYPLDQYVVSFDDDVAGVAVSGGLRSYPWGQCPAHTTTLTAHKARAFFRSAFQHCCRTGARLWGVNTCGNNLSLELPGAAAKGSLGLVNGGLFGFRVIKDPELFLRQTASNGVLEDFERSVRFFLRHGTIARFGSHCIVYYSPPKSESSSLSAGVGGDANRLLAAEAAGRRLVAAFPEFVRLDPGGNHPVALVHLQSCKRRAPSCQCMSCCLCTSRDNAATREEAVSMDPPGWCRSCRNQHAVAECSRRDCVSTRCHGAHCFCNGKCTCRNQLGCPFLKKRKR